VSRLAPENGRAEAFGTYNAVQGFGSILGPLLGGFAAQYLGYAMAFGTSVALILGGCVILAATRVSEKQRSAKTVNEDPTSGDSGAR
jgi:MFS family permease